MTLIIAPTRGKRIGHAGKKFSLVKELTDCARDFLHENREKLCRVALRFCDAARACPCAGRGLGLIARPFSEPSSTPASHVEHHHPRRLRQYRLHAEGKAGLQALRQVRQGRAHRHVQEVQENAPRLAAQSRQVLGQDGGRAGLVQAVEKSLRVEATLRRVVHRRQAQRQLQLPRPPSRRPAAQQGRHHLGRRARRGRHPHLPAVAPRSLPARQRAQEARREVGRPRHDLPADDPRGGHGHARLRAHRRPAQASSSPASARRRSRNAPTIAAPRSSSRPTAATAAARPSA